MNVTMKGIPSRRVLIVLYFSSIVASGSTYQTQPLIFALRNYYGQSAANVYNKIASVKTERRVEEKEEDEEYEYEDEDEEYDDYQPPRIVFKPLIVVLLEGLMAVGSSLRPAAAAAAAARSSSESYEEEEIGEEEAGASSSPSVFREALALPFKVLQEYGMSALSTYFPGIEQLKDYGQFYENLARTTNAVQQNKKVQEMAESLRKEAPSRSTFETFSMYFPYAIITLKLGSYFIPGLGQVKTVLVGLEIIRISWKTASMYNRGDSFNDILKGLGKEFINAAISRRAELEPLTTPSTLPTFVVLSSMDVDTFVTLVNESNCPPLADEDEATMRADVVDVVDSYFDNEGLIAEQKTQIIATIQKAAKFIALHAIIPALMANNSGGANP